MAIQKNDFIEMEFIAKANGEVFDTSIKAEAEKAGLDITNFAPLIVSVGNGMLIKGLDATLEGKEIGKEYTSEFSPEEAFGKRSPQMVRMIPLKVFIQQKIMPEKGMQLSLDGMLVRVLSVSGGRVLVDFNNPLAGKTVSYTYTIKKKVDDLNEKINAIQDFFLRRRFDFEVSGKDVVFKVEENIGKFLQLFEKQFEDMLGMKIKISPVKKEEKKAEKVEEKN